MKPSSFWGTVNAPNRSTAPGVFARPGLNGTSHRDFTTKTWGIFGVYTIDSTNLGFVPKWGIHQMAVEWGIHECMKQWSMTLFRTLYVQSNVIQLKVLDPPRLAGWWLKISDIPWANLQFIWKIWTVRWLVQDSPTARIWRSLRRSLRSYHVHWGSRTSCKFHLWTNHGNNVMQRCILMVPFVPRTMVQRV